MMKSLKKYSGVIVPLVTPINIRKGIDKVSTKRLVKFIVDNGCNPFVLGSTGEAASLPAKMKYELLEYAIETNDGQKTFYAGISGTCFSDVVEMANRFFDMGADATVAHLPAGYPLSPEQMERFFNELADSLKGPLIIYNIKATTNMSIPVEVLDKLSYHPNIAGFKDSERNDERLIQQISLWKDRSDFSFFCGWAARSAYSLANGADGIVPSTGNFVPGLYHELFEAIIKGDFTKAGELQKTTDDISAIYQKDKVLSQSLPGLKIMLRQIGICQPFTMPPCYELTQDENEYIIRCIGELKSKNILK